MESFKANESVENSMEALIDWSTPEIVKYKAYDENCFNNPFDVLELQAANMDPFDIVPDQTPLKGDPPCGNILSPLWQPKVRPISKSISLTDIVGVARLLEQNNLELHKDDIMKNQSKGNSAMAKCAKANMINQSIENNVSVHIGENKIEFQEPSNQFVLITDQNELEMEKKSYCNEQEKKLIREQTRQRIEMLIETGEKNYSRKSLYCTPQRSNTDLNLNKHTSSSVFNRGFIGSCCNTNFNSINKTSVSKNKLYMF